MIPPEVPEITRKESSPPCEAEVRAVVSFDEMMSRIGEFGLFQFLAFIVFSFGVIMEVMFLMAFVFEAATPDHWCATPQLDHLNISTDDRLRLTIPADPKAGNGYSTCAMYDIDYTNWTQTDINDWLTLGPPLNASQISCRDGWSYDRSVYSETIVTQWDLVCDENWKASFAYSAIGIGQLVGAMFWGSVIDRFGRKKPYFLAMTSMVTFAIAVSFSPNYIVYCILQSLMGINTVATYAAGVTLAVEMTGIRFRGHLATAINYAWTFGYMVLALIAYGLRGWRMLQLVISASSSVLLLSVFFVPESVRWLYSKKRNIEAEAILRRVSRVNRKLYPEDVDVQVIDEELSSGSFLDLFRTPKIRRNSLILLLNWFSNGFIYYGISLFLPSMGGNAYLNFFISGAIEIPGYIVAQTSIAYIGRKWPLCVTMTTGGIALLCTMGVPESLNWLSITLAMIGKLCITASWAIVICFTAELYPTVIRGVGFFICTLCGNIGNILAPLVGLLTVYSWYLPLVIFGGFSIVSGLASILLPETRGRPLPDTIEDAESRIGLTGDSESMASKEDRSPEKDQSSGKDRSLGKDQSPKNGSSFRKSLKVSPGDVSEQGEVNQMEDIQEHF